jgi:F-type H+-transporting ATPase subunit b
MHIFFLSEGFGFNTDVLETNILNLAVVLAIVVVYVGDAFSAMLDARRDRIVKSVQTAEYKYAAAQDALKQAQQRLTDAQCRAATIRSEGSATVSQVTALVASQANEELARLEDLKTTTFALAEQKATKQLQAKLVQLALTKAGSKLSTRLASQATQKAFVDLQIQTLRTQA